MHSGGKIKLIIDYNDKEVQSCLSDSFKSVPTHNIKNVVSVLMASAVE